MADNKQSKKTKKIKGEKPSAPVESSSEETISNPLASMTLESKELSAVRQECERLEALLKDARDGQEESTEELRKEKEKNKLLEAELKKEKSDHAKVITKLKVQLSKQQWEELNIKLRGNQKGMEDILVLSHCTPEENKKGILDDKKLLKHKTKIPSTAPLATGRDVKGVWFTASLFESELMTISPYGPQRIQYPIINLMEKHEWSLFFDSTYYYEENGQYVRVVLAKPTDKGFEWCKENLHEVDFGDNQVLCLGDEKSLKVCKNIRDSGITMYVVILVLGDVPITGKEKWDPVTDNHKKQLPGKEKKPTYGFSPRL